ncbi:MAG: hypothetical protein KAH01_01935 [Caldisericia bacterium]|nr:hypothetical protein [Caldisericia bacterium]
MYCINTKSKKLFWKHDFPTVNQNGIMYRNPICTSNGIIMIRTDINSKSLTIQCLNSDNGNMLWNQKLPYTIDPNSLLNTLVSVSEKEISMYIEAFQQWNNSYVPKIIVLSLKSGVLVREYSLTKNLQTLTGIGDNILVTTKKVSKKPTWIAVIDRATGQTVTTENLIEGSILSYPIIENDKVWLLTRDQGGDISIVELLIQN